MGDGINDAPSHADVADVGISVDTAVDVAKESADIILLEKSLLVLEDGIIEGRKVFGNIIKYIRMGASSNFGNMFSMLGGSYFLPFLPMAPIQMLVNNLLYDFSQIGIPTDHVDEEYLLTPRKWNIENIQQLHDLHRADQLDLRLRDILPDAVFLQLPSVLGTGADGRRIKATTTRSLFHTGWFVESLLTQTLIVHIIRTNRIPFLQSIASPFLIFTTLRDHGRSASALPYLAVCRAISASCRCRPSSGGGWRLFLAGLRASSPTTMKIVVHPLNTASTEHEKPAQRPARGPPDRAAGQRQGQGAGVSRHPDRGRSRTSASEGGITEKVLAREQPHNTGIGKGWACPHARSPRDGELRLRRGLEPAGIDYGAPDGQPVHLVVMYFVPDAQKNAYLKEISSLAKAITTRPELQDPAEAHGSGRGAQPPAGCHQRRLGVDGAGGQGPDDPARGEAGGRPNERRGASRRRGAGRAGPPFGAAFDSFCARRGDDGAQSGQ